MKGRFLDRPRVLNRLKTKTRGGFPVKPETGLLTDEVNLVSFWNSWYDEPTDAGGLGIDKCVLFARVAELADAEVSKTSAERRAGSSPALGTMRFLGPGIG